MKSRNRSRHAAGEHPTIKSARYEAARHGAAWHSAARHGRRRGSLLLRRRTMTLALTVSAATIVAALIAGATSPTWAFWASSNVSGSTTATVTSLNAQAAPTVSSTDRAVVVHWAPNTLATGSAATGYTVKRYSAGNVAQVVANNCAGIIKNYGCIEQFVPAGTWTYTVTARFDTDGGAGWYGAESAKSAAVTSNGVSSTNNVWMWITP